MNVIELERILDLGKLYEDIRAFLVASRNAIQPRSAEDMALSLLRMMMETDIVDECYKEDWKLLDSGETSMTFDVREPIEEEPKVMRNVRVVLREPLEERVARLERRMDERESDGK